MWTHLSHLLRTSASRWLIYIDGSEEQKLNSCRRWHAERSAVSLDGAARRFRRVRRTNDNRRARWRHRILNGEKRWIGNAPWCDVSSSGRDVVTTGQRFHRREQDHTGLQR